MSINHQNQTFIRCGIALLWVLGFIAATSSEAVAVVYLLPALALITFLLTDYLSGFVIALVLTLVVKGLYPDQISGVTRAVLTDVIWIAAIVAASIKLPKLFAQKSTPVTINYQLDELPINFRHDLQTHIRMITGFCNAILRTEDSREPILRDNVQAISRNARQLENMFGDLLNRPKVGVFPEAEEVEPIAFIQETVNLAQSLMAARQLRLMLQRSDPLPRVTLQRLTTRQVLLNTLRTIARVSSEPDAFITINARVGHSDLGVTVTTLSTIMRRVVADASWSMNERLLESIGGHFDLTASSPLDTDVHSSLAITFPVRVTARPIHRIDTVRPKRVLIISEESSVIDLFKEHLDGCEIIGIKNVTAFSLLATHEQPDAVILTREQQIPYLQKISEFVGAQKPIIGCKIVSAEEQLQQLKVTYLPKPIDYNTLFRILTRTGPLTKNILIVDDNADSCEMMAQMVSAISPTFVSMKAFVARDALVLLDEHNISAIILDVALPDMDGVTLAQQIRSREHYADVPIMLVSAREHLDSVMPIIASDRISLLHVGRFEADTVVSWIKTLVNNVSSQSP